MDLCQTKLADQALKIQVRAVPALLVHIPARQVDLIFIIYHHLQDYNLLTS